MSSDPILRRFPLAPTAGLILVLLTSAEPLRGAEGKSGCCRVTDNESGVTTCSEVTEGACCASTSGKEPGTFVLVWILGQTCDPSGQCVHDDTPTKSRCVSPDGDLGNLCETPQNCPEGHTCTPL